MNEEIQEILTSYENGQKRQAYDQIIAYNPNHFFVDWAENIKSVYSPEHADLTLFVSITNMYFNFVMLFS